MRKLTSRNFTWRKDGPVHNFFLTRFAPEYFRAGFEGPGDAFRFVGGTLSPASLAQFKASLERLAIEFEELARNDARLPLAKRDGCSAILSVRSLGVLGIRALAAPQWTARAFALEVAPLRSLSKFSIACYYLTMSLTFHIVVNFQIIGDDDEAHSQRLAAPLQQRVLSGRVGCDRLAMRCLRF